MTTRPRCALTVKLVVLGLILGLVLQPAVPVLAQDTTPEVTPENFDPTAAPSLTEPLINADQFFHSIDGLDWLINSTGQTRLAPTDQSALTKDDIDRRLTDYLLYLTKPIEFGGAGLSHIKAQRIIKNYTTQRGVGRFDREGPSANDEELTFISTHNRGQAVDISEVGQVTCKMVQRRHIGGSSTKWQAPRPVAVDWQSKDGINRVPTPRGPSLMEVSAELSAQGVLTMLNETGEMDAYVEYAKGLDLATIFTYAGANILLKNLGSTKITNDPLADSLINTIGLASLTKALPNLPEGMNAGSNEEDFRVVAAKANLESQLNLPSGSLREAGWSKILENIGQRTLENALGLPALYLTSHTLEETNKLPAVQTSWGHLQQGDTAFGVVPGTIEKLKQNNSEGFKLAGINLFASAFKLSANQRQLLIDEMVANKQPSLDPTTFPVQKEFSPAQLENFFSTDPKKQRQAEESFRQTGAEMMTQLLTKAVPSRYEGITRDLLRDFTKKGEDINFGELKQTIGSKRLAIEAGSDPSAAARQVARDDRRYAQTVANFLNQEYDLSNSSTISVDDVLQASRRGQTGLIEKIAASQIDRSLGWNVGTGLQIIRQEKKIDVAVKEIFADQLGQMLGLDPGSSISLEGDLPRNYGRALAEQRLGLPSKTLEKKGQATDFSSDELNTYFELGDSRDLTTLRSDSGFWNNQDNIDRWLDVDARLGLKVGSTQAFLLGESSSDQLASQTAQDNLTTLGAQVIWDQLDLGDQFRLSNDEVTSLISTLKDWNSVSLEQKNTTLGLATKLITRTFDQNTGFAIDSFLSIAQSGTTAATTDVLIDQGIRLLAGVFGSNIGGYTEERVNSLAGLIKDAFNGNDEGRREALTEIFLDASGIPDEFRSDAAALARGDLRTAWQGWSAVIWENFANTFLPAGSQLSYGEVRQAYIFEDQTSIDQRALELYNDAINTNGSALPETFGPFFRSEARKQLMQEARDNAQYKISDAFLLQAGITIPENFSKAMFSGSSTARAEAAEELVFAALDKELIALDNKYQLGTLIQLFNGEISKTQADKVVLSILNRQGLQLGPFDQESALGFYSYISSGQQNNFYSDDRFNSMWGSLDGWFAGQLNIADLPTDFSRSIFYASQNNWDFNAGVSENGQVIVPSLKSMGEGFFESKLTNWADSAFRLPAGSTYQAYQAIQGLNQATAAYQQAKVAGDAAKISSTSQSLHQAQAQLTTLAITIALNSCQACQQFFGSIDSALSAPPGFTNAAVAGGIAMALGLGPAGLFIAAAIFAFGVYKVDYLCPIPPPDIYARTGFDPDYDTLKYKWGDYYTDPNHPERLEYIKATPDNGLTPWEWQDGKYLGPDGSITQGDGVKFANGNDPELWMAWSRYFVGLLLEKTAEYGEARDRPYKPKQIITLRQANVEFFASRSVKIFGEIERTNPSIGMGYSQTSTKTTNWVHTAFGGFF